MWTLVAAAAVGTAMGPGGINPQLATSFAERREQDDPAPVNPGRVDFHISKDHIESVDNAFAKLEAQLKAHSKAAEDDKESVEKKEHLKEHLKPAPKDAPLSSALDSDAAPADAAGDDERLPPSTASLVEQVHRQAREFVDDMPVRGRPRAHQWAPHPAADEVEPPEKEELKPPAHGGKAGAEEWVEDHEMMAEAHAEKAMHAWDLLNEKMMNSPAMTPAMRAKWAQLSQRMHASEAHMATLRHRKVEEAERLKRHQLIAQLPTRRERAQALHEERHLHEEAMHMHMASSQAIRENAMRMQARHLHAAHSEAHAEAHKEHASRRVATAVQADGTLAGGVSVAQALAAAREAAADRSAAYKRHYHQIAALKHHEFMKEAHGGPHGPIYHPTHMPGHPHHDPLAMTPPVHGHIDEQWIAVPKTELQRLHSLEGHAKTHEPKRPGVPVEELTRERRAAAEERRHVEDLIRERRAVEERQASRTPMHSHLAFESMVSHAHAAPKAPEPHREAHAEHKWHPDHKVGDWHKDKHLMAEHQVEEALVATLLAKLGGDRAQLASLLETHDAASLIKLAEEPDDIKDLLEPMKITPPVLPIEIQQEKEQRKESWEKMNSEEKSATRNINNLLKEVEQMKAVDAAADKQMRLHK